MIINCTHTLYYLLVCVSILNCKIEDNLGTLRLHLRGVYLNHVVSEAVLVWCCGVFIKLYILASSPSALFEAITYLSFLINALLVSWLSVVKRGQVVSQTLLYCDTFSIFFYILASSFVHFLPTSKKS